MVCKISVIVPCYNQEKYIRECLESVLKQTFSDYEAIVVNDGSTDSSLSIIQSYTDKYDNFHLINQQNQVVVSALYRKSDWEKYGGYDENMKNGLEDWEFWLNFIEDKKIFYCICETLMCYRISSFSRSTQINKQQNKNLKRYVYKKHRFLLPYVIFHKVCRFFFQTKLTKSGKLQLKFFKIPISIKLLLIEGTLKER